MKASLILNESGEMGFFYGEDLGLVPEWAAIDIERGELYIHGENEESRSLDLEGMDEKIYQRVMKEKKIFLVEVENNNITTPKKAQWVNLMVSQQI